MLLKHLRILLLHLICILYNLSVILNENLEWKFMELFLKLLFTQLTQIKWTLKCWNKVVNIMNYECLIYIWLCMQMIYVWSVKLLRKENRNRGLTKASNSWFLTNRRMRSICISSWIVQICRFCSLNFKKVSFILFSKTYDDWFNHETFDLW